MELYKTTSFLWYYLTILLAFGQVLEAQAPPETKKEKVLLPLLPTDEPLPAKDSLQIKLDRDLYGKDSLVFSSHLEFKDPQTITDSQLRRIAVDAYDEMRSMAKKNGVEAIMPRVMTTLVVGKELVFASSAKGPNTPYGTDSQVQADLNECSKDAGGGKHKNWGRCGEVMALHEYYQSHGITKRLEQGSDARIVAIAGIRNAKGQLEKVIVPPCGDEHGWGCDKLVRRLNVLDDKKVEMDKATPALRYKNLISEKKLGTWTADTAGSSKEKQTPRPGGNNDEEFEEPPKYKESTPKKGRPARKPQQPTRNQGKTAAQDKRPSHSREQENDGDFEEPPKYEDPSTSSGERGKNSQKGGKNPKTNAQKNKTGNRQPRHFQA